MSVLFLSSFYHLPVAQQATDIGFGMRGTGGGHFTFKSHECEREFSTPKMSWIEKFACEWAGAIRVVDCTFWLLGLVEAEATR